ncbi:hypothetical protein ABI59_14115 [Acidobacteria bacterium Mor1]|nr:hypothetical protein ABI59_14115 [Acidobacteria bacterium Mor1]
MHRPHENEDQETQTSEVCERFHTTVPEQFYWVRLRDKIYSSIEELHADLDAWLSEYNQNRHLTKWLVRRQDVHEGQADRKRKTITA